MATEHTALAWRAADLVAAIELLELNAAGARRLASRFDQQIAQHVLELREVNQAREQGLS